MAWDDARVEMLKTLWAEGKTAAEIANEFGDISRNAVIGKAHRLGLSNRTAQQKTAETDTKEPQELVKSSPKKKTTSKTAAEKSTASKETKAAPDAPAKSAKAKASTSEKSAKVAQKPAEEAPARAEASKKKPPIELVQQDVEAELHEEDFEDEVEEGENPIAALAAEAERTSRKLNLLELNERTCKWPIGDPSTDDFYFCGHPCAPEKPYCAAHVQVAYQPMSSRRDRDRERSRSRAATA